MIQGPWFLHGNQCTEFGAMILKDETSFLIANCGVTTGDGHVGDAHIAFMASAQLQQLVFCEGNDM
eukprot:CAMPEP_0181431976 /NCGR_PEP_ID=MMETSP1110-20121109/18530_1 /TAXON_ID=174948 /ORGANISM="Symbiodinium sp., Strain CCMP421" /LENGTH=65 /DNA_ID=CAMNT_0023555367 /DNA_START=291 /DNA_END=488 /DNA_ORIENTATION=-